jgi:hypothetical protein
VIPAGQPGHCFQILSPRHGGLDRGKLPGQRNDPAHCRRVTLHIVPANPQDAAVQANERRYRADKGRLAGAIRSQ